jgi:hypothetical protein
LQAYYSGDANYAAISSAALPQVVKTVGATGFASGNPVAVGRAPMAIVAADLNGDGRMDLAVANSGDNRVSILLGNGDGTFLPAVNIPVGATPNSLAAGDFNGDGKVDLVVVNSAGGNLSLLMGHGDGTFQQPVVVTAGLGPASVAVADFNRDGKADLVVYNQIGQNFSILLGNGDGTFQAPLGTLASLAGYHAFTVTDLNSDGKADLAVAINSSLQGELMGYLGLGNGSFSVLGGYQLGTATGPLAITAGDFRNTGIIDIAVADYEGSVYWVTNNGLGGFIQQSKSTAGLHPWAITSVDADGDGLLDLLVVNNGDNSVSILRNRGLGAFDLPVSYPTGSSPVALATGDFNGDGIADVAVVNYGDGSLSVLLGK